MCAKRRALGFRDQIRQTVGSTESDQRDNSKHQAARESDARDLYAPRQL